MASAVVRIEARQVPTEPVEPARARSFGEKSFNGQRPLGDSVIRFPFWFNWSGPI